MNTIILQGDDTEKIYTRLNQIVNKAKKNEYILINVSDNDFNIIDIIYTNDLFRRKKLIVFNNYNRLKPIINNINKEKFSNDNIYLCIISEAILNKKNTEVFGENLKIETYVLPKLIWKYLDSLKPKNAKLVLGLLDTLSKNESVELIFHLTSKRFIELYYAKYSPNLLDLQQWQIVKLQNQADGFTLDLLKSLINELSMIDIKVKKGEGNLRSLLDFFVTTKLE